MAQTRRTAGAGARRRAETGEASRGARGRERQETEHDRAAHGHDHTTREHDRTPHAQDHAAHESISGARGAHTGGEPSSLIDTEQLQEMATEMAPQLGAAAVAAIATAVLLPEFLPAVLIGAGATLAPRLLPGMGSMFRPVMKTVMRAGYAAYSSVQHFAAEAGEQMQDVIAEVQSENRARGTHRSPTGSRPGSEAGAAAH